MAKVVTFTTQQIIHAPIEKVWAFFSDPRNLNELTPPQMQFRIETPLPPRVYTGLIIAYTVRIMPFFRTTWVTEIRHVEERQYFVDEQRIGPYRFWYHEHRFESLAEGVQMTDTVYYSVGYGWIGTFLNRVWIRHQLKSIFEYRRKAIGKIFS